MKTLYALLLSLSLALSAPAFALNGSGNVSNVIGPGAIGSATQPQWFMAIPSGVTVFSLYVGDNNTLTAGSFYPLYMNGVAYHTGLNSNKKTYCFDITASSGTASNSFQFVSATGSFTYGQSTALSGGLYQGGSAAKYPNLVSSAASTTVAIPGIYTFGDGVADTYAGVQVGNSQIYQIHMDCYQ